MFFICAYADKVFFKTYLYDCIYCICFMKVRVHEASNVFVGLYCFCVRCNFLFIYKWVCLSMCNRVCLRKCVLASTYVYASACTHFCVCEYALVSACVCVCVLTNISEQLCLFLLLLFNGISAVLGYLMPNPSF